MTVRQLPAVGGHPDSVAGTLRTDRWWVEPAITFAVLMAFVIYGTWAAFQGNHYFADPYLSPFYSPVLFTDLAAAGAAPTHHAIFGEYPSWWPSLIPRSPAMLILIFPGLFRLTCYYYRKAYYRSFTGSPPACSVVPVGKTRAYRGETAWLLFQNLHRYALYPAIVYIFILYYDAGMAFFKHGEFGIGVGSIVLTVNATLLAGYTFGCHSFRHLIGGGIDVLSGGRAGARFRAWQGVSWCNALHPRFAWASLVWVGLTDVYVRLVSMGVIRDFNTWG